MKFRNGLQNTLIGVAVCAMIGLHLYSANRSGPLFDEPAHFASGAVLGRTGDLGYFKVNPPLNKWITALSTNHIDLEILTYPKSSSFANTTRPEFQFGDDLLEANRDNYLQMLQIARYARIPFLLLGAWMLWRTLAGQMPWRRILVVWLWAFSPLILGHGWIVSADGIAGVAMCFIILTAIRLWNSPTWLSYAISGCAWGLAIGTKFTFAPLYLFFIPAIEIARAGREPRSSLNFRSCGKWLGRWATHAVVACIVLNGLYVFDGTGKRIADHEFISDLFHPFGSLSENPIDERKFGLQALSRLPSPFPESFLEGIDQQLADMDRPRGAYLMGTRYQGQLPWFFLVGYWMKEQLAVWVGVLLIAANLIVKFVQRLCLRSVSKGSAAKPNQRPDDSLDVFAGVSLLGFALLMTEQSNLVWNMRYLTPAVPLVYILLARNLPDWGRLKRQHATTIPVTCWALMALIVIECIHTAPFHFSYINPVFGGSYRNPIALNDSNFDYGQDALYLRHWVEQEFDGATSGDRPIILTVISGHGRLWLDDICQPASPEAIERALNERKNAHKRGELRQSKPREVKQLLVVSRGLYHPEPWAKRYSSFADRNGPDQRSHALLKELLLYPPDVWITPVIAGYWTDPEPPATELNGQDAEP